jgi:hypothetical protein
MTANLDHRVMTLRLGNSSGWRKKLARRIFKVLMREQVEAIRDNPDPNTASTLASDRRFRIRTNIW